MGRVVANPKNVFSFVSGEDMSNYQYRAVKVADADIEVVAADSAAAEGQHIIGVLQNDPSSGKEASVATGGISRLEMNANCDRGEKIQATTNGKGTPAASDQNSVIGIALSSNSAGDGGIISVLITPGGVAQANESD